MYEKLLDFHEENGHYHVPCSYKSDPPFSKWVTKQKAALRTDDLSIERKEKLQSIGFPGPKPARKKRKRVKEPEEEEEEVEKTGKKQAVLAEQDVNDAATS